MNRKLKVLVVDDNPADVYLVKRLLGEIVGWQVDCITCENGKQALKKMRERDPDVCIVDYVLRAETGTEVIRRMKEAGSNAAFILLTSRGDESVAIEALREGISDYLTKSELSPGSLERSLRHVIERKRADEELRLQSEITATLIEGIYLVRTSDAVIVHANRKFEEIFGYDPGELVGKHVSIVNAPTEKTSEETTEEIMKVLNEKGVWKGEVYNIKKDGTPFWSYASVSTFKHYEYGEVLIAVHTDITERKRAEETLRKFNKAVEQTADMVVIADREGNIEYVNQAIERITGYSREELIGQNLEARLLLSGQQDKDFYKQMWDTVSSGRIWQGRIVNRKKSGELYDEEMTISPILDDSGKITNFVLIKRDVSKEKILQKRLIQAAKLSSIGTFVSGIAHELNNPLTAILGFSERLIKRKNPPPDIAENLKIISDQAKRTVEIVKNLLAFSRMQKEEKTLVRISDIVDSTLSLQSYPLNSDNIEVRKNYRDDLPLVSANINQLQQVFMKIILNAQHAMVKANGKGVLAVSTDIKNNEVIVSFENNGPPIPAESLDKIFDPFYTIKETREGTGLGLYISYGIIKDHDGRIWAENMGDAGVRFCIALPAVTEKEAGKKAETKEKPARKGIRVLLVEDEAPIRKWLSAMLADEGFLVITGSNGEEAIKLLKEEDFDAIISDVKMPKMSGLELGKWLHENRPGSLKRFILATGMIDMDIEEYCGKYGCNVITKPFDEEKVLETLDMVMER